MIAIPNSKNWLTKITSLWQPKSDYSSPKQVMRQVEESNTRMVESLERLNEVLEKNNQVLDKLVKYLEVKGL